MTEIRQGSGKPGFQAKRGSAIVGLSHTQDVSVDEESQGVLTLGKDSERGQRQYDYRTGAGLSTQPAIVDGAVYVGAGDGGLYAFTNHGQAPENALEHAFVLQLEKNRPIPARWPAKIEVRRRSL